MHPQTTEQHPFDRYAENSYLKHLVEYMDTLIRNNPFLAHAKGKKGFFRKMGELVFNSPLPPEIRDGFRSFLLELEKNPSFKPEDVLDINFRQKLVELNYSLEDNTINCAHKITHLQNYARALAKQCLASPEELTSQDRLNADLLALAAANPFGVRVENYFRNKLKKGPENLPDSSVAVEELKANWDNLLLQESDQVKKRLFELVISRMPTSEKAILGDIMLYTRQQGKEDEQRLFVNTMQVITADSEDEKVTALQEKLKAFLASMQGSLNATGRLPEAGIQMLFGLIKTFEGEINEVVKTLPGEPIEMKSVEKDEIPDLVQKTFEPEESKESESSNFLSELVSKAPESERAILEGIMPYAKQQGKEYEQRLFVNIMRIITADSGDEKVTALQKKLKTFLTPMKGSLDKTGRLPEASIQMLFRLIKVFETEINEVVKILPEEPKPEPATAQPPTAPTTPASAEEKRDPVKQAEQGLDLPAYEGGDIDYRRLIEEQRKHIQKCREVLEKHPDDHEAHLNLGIALFAVNEHEEALKYFKKSIELNPDKKSEEVRVSRGHIKTIEEYGFIGRAVPEVDPKSVTSPEDALKMANFCTRERKDPEGAKKWFSRAIELQSLKEIEDRQEQPAPAPIPAPISVPEPAAPAEPKTAEELASELVKSHEYHKKAYQGIIEDPNSTQIGWAHFNLGIICNNEGDLESAKKHYRKAIELEPGYSFESYRSLGSIFEKQGDFKSAKENLQQALALAPNDPNYDLVKEELKKKLKELEEKIASRQKQQEPVASPAPTPESITSEKIEIVCDNCNAIYQFFTTQIPPDGYDAECTACKSVFFVSPSRAKRISDTPPVSEAFIPGAPVPGGGMTRPKEEPVKNQPEQSPWHIPDDYYDDAVLPSDDDLLDEILKEKRKKGFIGNMIVNLIGSLFPKK